MPGNVKEAAAAIKGMKGMDNETMIVMVKLMLQSAQQIRELQGAVFRVYIVDATSPIVAAATAAGINYRDMPLKNREGSPHLHVWTSVIKALAEMPASSGIKADTLADLNKYYMEKIMTSSTTALEAEIRAFRVRKAYDKDTKKILVRLETPALDQMIHQAFIALGITMKSGGPPAAPLERFLERFLDDKGQGHKEGFKDNEKKAVDNKEGTKDNKAAKKEATAKKRKATGNKEDEEAMSESD